MPVQERAKADAAQLVIEASSPSRQRKIVEVFDELSDCLCRVADMSDFVRVAHPNEQFASAAEHACVNISSLVEVLNTNTVIYEALKKAIEMGDCCPMDEVDRRVAELFLFDFQQSGIHLDEHKRREFVELSEIVLALGTAFTEGCHRPVFVRRDVLPEHLRNVFSSNGTNIMVNGLHSENPRDDVREAAYKIYLHPDAKQQQILDSLLDHRSKLASLTGFRSYAHRSLRGTMASTPEMVTEFLEALAVAIRPSVDDDVCRLAKVKVRSGKTSDVFPWDTTYYGSLVRQETCSINSSEILPYFSLGACVEGLSGLFTDLFGISLRQVEVEDGELWSTDVQKLAVVHETEGVLGVIYCDMFERVGKPHQDCHFTVRGGRQLADGSYQQPTVVLMLNLPRPRGSVPSLLTLNSVENLFHEFGHALHSMLGRTRYQHVTGTRCPTDFAEVPSVLMEYFASDVRVLSRFARHWQTGEPVPVDILRRVLGSRRLFAASELQQQVYYSLVDLAYHCEFSSASGKSTADIAVELNRKYCSLQSVPSTAWQLRFGHFVGYGARYYSYLMSRAVASRIWYQCFRENPFSRSAGEKYRRSLLAHGGEVPPTDLVEAALGEFPSSQMLVRALVDDLNDSEV